MSRRRANATSGGRAPGEPPFRYDARLAAEIEARWQERWHRDGTFWAPNPSGPLADGIEKFRGHPKSYILDMFAYPSAAGLHVGHPLGYIATDAYARYLRMTGQHVLHAMGYDAFGLPAEQYAIETGQHPQVTVASNIELMRGQLRRMGMGHDPRREIATTDPGFYRWTQWIFLQLFNSWYDERQGRARPVPELAAEFEAGTREPSGPANPAGRPWAELTEAERRAVVDSFRLAYTSDEPVNWCPGLGTVLANEEVTADGRSDIGNYPVYRRRLRQWMLRITAYADRLSKDLDLVDWPESIKLMQRNWIGASDGALITFQVAGGPAIEVFTTRADTLPAATYLVLAPEHPMAAEIATPGQQAAVAAYQEAACRLTDVQRGAESPGKTGVFTGAQAVNPATGESIPVYLADYVLMGYGTGAIMGVPGHDERDAEFAAQFGLPVRELADLQPVDQVIGQLERGGHGRRHRAYRMRDWLFSRQRYWGEPFPIVYDADGAPRALPEHLLPVALPEITDFRPQSADGGDPVPPLARAPGWAEVELDLGDGPRSYRRELAVMPQWAGSCWYYLRYLDPDNDRALADPEIERYWMAPGGVDLYLGGAEHAVLHLLYARFWHKVLYDLGHVSTPEPFARLALHGYVLADAFTDARGQYVPAAEVTPAPDGGYAYRGAPVSRRSGKMGKSLKNSVSPDEMYDSYGADTLRLHEMAMGPVDSDRPWRTADIAGSHRYLQRLWRSVVSEQDGSVQVDERPLDRQTARALHQAIAAVRRDFAALAFNTAIARLQELCTRAARIAAADGTLPRALAEPLVLMTAPLAPHIAEELWQALGHPESLAYAPFPEADESLAEAEVAEIPVQVDGRTRFTIEMPSGADEAALRAALEPRLAGLRVNRLIIVPDRIVNVVTSESAGYNTS
jgi:leucyl-tRNA synthetase